MMETVENDPAKFHIKNRGIIYRCEKFEVDNAARRHSSYKSGSAAR